MGVSSQTRDILPLCLEVDLFAGQDNKGKDFPFEKVISQACWQCP